MLQFIMMQGLEVYDVTDRYSTAEAFVNDPRQLRTIRIFINGVTRAEACDGVALNALVDELTRPTRKH